MAKFETLLVDVEQPGVVRLTLNRPAKKNALNSVMRDELATALADISADREVRVLVITGAGNTFCTGGDISEMQGSDRSAEAGRARLMRLLPIALKLYTLDIPVIAAVDGFAYGAGFNLALAADFVFASSEARFCQSFGRVGLVSDFGGHFILPRLIGPAKAKELIFTARELSAQEAAELGIAYRVVPRDELLPSAMELATKLKAFSPVALAQSKRILQDSFQTDLRTILEREATAQGICMASDFHSEAVAAFLQRRG